MAKNNAKKSLSLILNIMRDFKKFTGEPRATIHLSTKNFEPPSYVVQILLLNVLRMKDYGSMEKVWWHAYFEYKNQLFMIRDYKFGTWTIEGENDQVETLDKANEIRKKIQESSKHLDKILHEMMKNQVVRGNYYLNNSFHTLLGFYKFYKRQLQYTIRLNEKNEQERAIMRKPASEAKSLVEKDFQEFLQRLSATKRSTEPEIMYFLYGLMTIFFSLTDFLFEVLYAFERPNLTKVEFEKKSWYEKFRMFFPLTQDKTIAKLYGSFIDIKRNFRNPLTHGLTDESGILVPVKKVGLFPLSFEYPEKKLNYGANIPLDKAKEIIKTFESFLKYLSVKDPYRYYLYYVENRFPIPIGKSDVMEIKKEMTSFKNFKAYIDMQVEYADAVTNRDI